MAQANLEQLGREVLAHLQARNLAVFRSYPRGSEVGTDAIYWDTAEHPDFREFVAAAEAAGERLVTVAIRRFSAEMVEDTLEQLPQSQLDRGALRDIERRLRELGAYEGFVCQVELSFSHGRRTYVFDLAAEWYEELLDLMDEVEDSLGAALDENPLGGYYSNN
jgi:hypothetical protein